jgi:putative ABC transport system permease protein
MEVPALRTSALNLHDSLQEGGRGSTEGIRRNVLRSLLVASKSALALVLLIGAGLMIRNIWALESIDPGFNPHHLLTLVVKVNGSQVANGPRRAAGKPKLENGGRQSFHFPISNLTFPSTSANPV